MRIDQMDIEFWDKREHGNASRLTMTVYNNTQHNTYEKYLSRYLTREETVALFPDVENYAGFTEWASGEYVVLLPNLPEVTRQWLIKAMKQLDK